MVPVNVRPAGRVSISDSEDAIKKFEVLGMRVEGFDLDNPVVPHTLCDSVGSVERKEVFDQKHEKQRHEFTWTWRKTNSAIENKCWTFQLDENHLKQKQEAAQKNSGTFFGFDSQIFQGNKDDSDVDVVVGKIKCRFMGNYNEPDLTLPVIVRKCPTKKEDLRK